MDDVYSLTGLNSLSAITDRNYGQAAIAGSAGNSTKDTGNVPQIWHPDHPLFWAGLLIASMFGLIGISTSAKVGPAKAGFSLGDKK